MYFKETNEKQAVNFTNNLLNFYKKIDSKSDNIILTHTNAEAHRNNTGWYQHVNDQHKLVINIPNILCAQPAVEQGIIDYDSFYALLTLCIGHEFRHFLQGRVIFDDKKIDGYTQEDVFNSELMLYIRYFFDAYYLLNKGNIKYELDAEKFSIINGLEYLSRSYPGIDAEKSMLDAINFYATIQSSGGIISTLPLGCRSIDEAIKKIEDKIQSNERISELTRTLFVYDPNFYQTHLRFGLDEDEVITNELLQEYYNEKIGSQRDLLVVKRIISLLKYPEDSLEEFPQLRKKYNSNSL